MPGGKGGWNRPTRGGESVLKETLKIMKKYTLSETIKDQTSVDCSDGLGWCTQSTQLGI